MLEPSRPKAASCSFQPVARLKLFFLTLHLQESYEDGCEDYPTLSEYVQDFLNHLTEQPGSFETEIDQFAETLNGWVTTDALQELVELVYQQVGRLVVCSMGWSSGSFLEAQGWWLLLEGGQVHVHLPPYLLTVWFMGAFRSLLYKISVVGDPGLEPDCKCTSVAAALDRHW